MSRLEGKTAIITGANSGVGAATALRFAKEGANVVISARRAEALEAVAAKITEAGGKVLCIPSDISKDEDCKALAAAAMEKFGAIDILVNNAGVLDSGLRGITNFLDEDFEKVVKINQAGTMQMIRAVLPHMTKGASIANVASVAGCNGGGGAVYVSTKAALIGITKHVALTMADKGIRCNAICPGTIITPMVAGMSPDNMDMGVMGAMSKHADIRGVSPCTPDDIANILLFLGSDESKPITGQIIVTDYGSTL